MDARIGDTIVIEGTKVGAGTRRGEVVEVLGAGRYHVRWSDGHETVITPGPGMVVERTGAAVRTETRSRDELRTKLDVDVREDDWTCDATVTLTTPTMRMVGLGHARRNPVDPNVPMIGEELAIARALSDLADELFAAARGATERHEDRALHLL